MSQQIQETKTQLQFVLERLFGSVGIILITQASRRKGIWKLGKTDLGLYLSQMCLKYGIVSEVATNINTFGHYPQVADLLSLKYWLHKSRRVKIYILDEINVHAPRRRAMSSKNIGILQIIPEISKARARIIIIGHELMKADKDLMTFGIVRGTFIKKTLKNVQLISHLFPKKYHFYPIPRTSIKFDPYETAPFTERPLAQVIFKDKDMQIFYKWAKGASWRELFKHPQECSRFIRKIGLKLCEKAFTDSQL